MLSILIPIYEVKVEKLVNKLIKQCRKAKIEFEILCFDDGSSDRIKQANRVIDSMMGVNYVELSENKGRSRIRNILTRTARYDYVLYLDADSKIERSTFIKSYLVHIAKYTIICGGRIYRSAPPKDINKLLHWTYGSNRESKNASIRTRKRVLYFHSNNFLADRKVMLENPFEEIVIEGYGYEDLALANQMDQRGVKIIHVDNPVIHGRLEQTDDFLEKGIQSMANLHRLYKAGMIPRTPLIKVFKLLDTYYLTDIYIKWYKKRKKSIMRNLYSGHPVLRNFDLFRLYYYIQNAEPNETQIAIK